MASFHPRRFGPDLGLPVDEILLRLQTWWGVCTRSTLEGIKIPPLLQIAWGLVKARKQSWDFRNPSQVGGHDRAPLFFWLREVGWARDLLRLGNDLCPATARYIMCVSTPTFSPFTTRQFDTYFLESANITGPFRYISYLRETLPYHCAHGCETLKMPGPESHKRSSCWWIGGSGCRCRRLNPRH